MVRQQITLSQLAQRLLTLIAAGTLLGAVGLAKAESMPAPEVKSAEARIVFANGASDPRSGPVAHEHTTRDTGVRALPDLNGQDSEVTIKEPRGAGIESPSVVEIRPGGVPPAFAASGPTSVLIPGALVVLRF
jgi:hypothetical protein